MKKSIILALVATGAVFAVAVVTKGGRRACRTTG